MAPDSADPAADFWGRMGCFKGCSCLFVAAALVAASLGLLASMGCHGCFCFIRFCVDVLVRSFVCLFFCTNGVEERVLTSWEGECEDYTLTLFFHESSKYIKIRSMISF